MVFAPLIARLYSLDTAGAERTAQLHVMTVFTLWFLPQMLFYGFTALATALLNARRRFVAAAYAPVLNNVVVIGVLVVFAQHAPPAPRSSWIDVRRISGDAGQAARCSGRARPPASRRWRSCWFPRCAAPARTCGSSFDWRHPAVRKMLRLSGWTVGYVVTNQIALLFVLVLAKSGTTGDVSAYLYAFIFFQLPHGLFAVSIMTTMMPELLAAATAPATSRSSRRRFRARPALPRCCSMLPAAVLFVVLAQPMVGVLVRGGFDAHDAAVTADTLQAFAIGLVPFSRLPVHAARLLRAARHAHAVLRSTRSRTA